MGWKHQLSSNYSQCFQGVSGNQLHLSGFVWLLFFLGTKWSLALVAYIIQRVESGTLRWQLPSAYPKGGEPWPSWPLGFRTYETAVKPAKKRDFWSLEIWSSTTCRQDEGLTKWRKICWHQCDITSKFGKGILIFYILTAETWWDFFPCQLESRLLNHFISARSFECWDIECIRS